MMTDPIADMLARIRNAGMAKHQELVIPASNTKLAIARVLVESGFLDDVRVEAREGRATLVVRIRYDDDGQPLLDGLKRVSRPGRRVYASVKNIPSVANGLGVSILSTPKGVMADHEAKAQNLGGEVLCRVF